MSALVKGVAVLSVTVAIFGCGNVSRGVARDGRSVDAIAWPSPTDVTPMHKGGTFPNLANLRQVHDGLNKVQIAELIGYPHFSEGLWGVREWNYLFSFRGRGSDEVTVCQYKVLFDGDRIAHTFYWKPESCASRLDEMKPVTQRGPRAITLSADAFFPFDKGSTENITQSGRSSLGTLASELLATDATVTAIRVIGYTDNMGSSAYNQTLSEHRAQSVREVLIDDGLPAEKLTAEGRGEADLVKECGDGSRTQRIDCLAPNRRVEVRADSGE